LTGHGCPLPADKGKKTFTASKTSGCLESDGAQVVPPAAFDVVATSAVGGSFNANLGDNSVTLVFGSDPNSGRNLADAYQEYAFPNVRGGVPDVLRRYNNVVTLWHKHPQEADLSLVVGCLR